MKRFIPIFAIMILSLSLAAQAASPSQTVPGVFALAGKPAAVDGTLTATAKGKTGEALDFVIAAKGTTTPLTDFTVEMTKEMHVIAVSDDLKTFLHDHVKGVLKDGHFRLTMKFPHPGLYHIYADTAPTGLGQQVLRFDVSVGEKVCDASAAEPVTLQPSGLTGASGPYEVRFDSLTLNAGDETMLALHILKNGDPANDIKPFLGVAAHAVFINAETLDYLHAHPMQMNGPMQMSGAMQVPALVKGNKRMDPNLMLHVEAPKAGLYALWIQFNAGGVLHTVPFVAEAVAAKQ